ncbi:MAG TPA: trigger factor [Thermodesulfobacteriota bacterium]|nr:trigger factor [Thermodesulfobacteriota bacterium]
MRVNFESLSNTEKKVEIFIPAEQVKGKIEEVIKELQLKARIKGFRPGKVPRKVIEGMYGDSIFEEVSSRLISESFEKALDENSVIPVSRPQVTKDKVEPDKEFHYTAVFEVIPDFEPKDYAGIELKKERQEVKEEDIERTLNELRERAVEAKPLGEEREARKGDFVVVDYEGFLDGKSVKELKQDDAQFPLGEGQLIAEFEDNIAGMKKGEEREFQVTYSEDFQMKEVAGKTVNFRVRLKDIRERVLPEIDDEFAKDVGEEDLEGLKKKIRENLEKRFEKESKDKLNEELINMLIERNPVDVPQSMIENELARLKRELAFNLQRHGLQIPQLNQEAEGQFMERAVHNVKASLIMGAIARKEGVKASDEEVNNKLTETAASLRLPIERVREVYEKNDMIEGLRARLIEEKVIDFLLEKSNVAEVSPEQIQIDKEG